jgi:hypothetical protein
MENHVARSGGTIDSIDSLRRRMRTIVEAVNADPSLALRASANPLLALEELGYELSGGLREEAELRARFGLDDVAALTSLREDIERQLGRKVDLRSADAVTRALASVGVKIPAKAFQNAMRDHAAAGSAPEAPERAVAQTSKRTSRRGRTPTTPRPPIIEPPASVLGPDDSRRLLWALRERRDAHDVVEPLVQYLELEAGRPRLAHAETYARLREQAVDPDRTDIRVRFVLQRERDDG